MRKKAWLDGLVMRAQKDQQDREIIARVLGPEAAEKGVKIYTYSQHANNFKLMAYDDMRCRLAKKKVLS